MERKSAGRQILVVFCGSDYRVQSACERGYWIKGWNNEPASYHSNGSASRRHC